MNTDLQQFRNLSPNISDNLVREHLSRLTPGYFESFSKDVVCNHLTALSALSAENTVHVSFEYDEDNGLANCTFVAFDYPIHIWKK